MQCVFVLSVVLVPVNTYVANDLPGVALHVPYALCISDVLLSLLKTGVKEIGFEDVQGVCPTWDVDIAGLSRAQHWNELADLRNFHKLFYCLGNCQLLKTLLRKVNRFREHFPTQKMFLHRFLS